MFFWNGQLFFGGNSSDPVIRSSAERATERGARKKPSNFLWCICSSRGAVGSLPCFANIVEHLYLWFEHWKSGLKSVTSVSCFYSGTCVPSLLLTPYTWLDTIYIRWGSRVHPDRSPSILDALQAAVSGSSVQFLGRMDWIWGSECWCCLVWVLNEGSGRYPAGQWWLMGKEHQQSGCWFVKSRWLKLKFNIDIWLKVIE